jgi:hypothetical protein
VDQGWVTVPAAIPAIISPEVWAAAQEVARTNTRTAQVKPLKRSYALRGLLICGHCGRRLGGEVRRSRGGSETSRYVCKLRDLYPGQVNHPLKVTIAESAISPLLEEWVAEELSPARLDLRAEQLASVDGIGTRREHALDQLRSQEKVARSKLDRLYELMQDPDYPIDTARAAVREQKAKLARIEADIAGARGTAHPTWSVDDYRAALRDGLGDIPGLLEVANDQEKNSLYRLLGMELTYTRTGPRSGHLTGVIRPHLQQRGELLRVGGGT